MTKICEVCGKEFPIKPSEAHRRRTCSKECSGKYRSMGKVFELECYICGEKVRKTKSQIERSVSGHVFCSNECVGKYNAQQRKQNIIKNCVICGKPFKTINARKDTHITCSRKCQGKWQSKYRVGENASNFRGGGGIKKCKNCGEEFEVEYKNQFKTRVYCSMECKREYWRKNTLHTKKFKLARYQGNLKFRQSFPKESTPERMVREYLESKGLIKGKDFFQEQGFFHKYYVDFYIPKTKTVIEVHGDFWHGNPAIYGEGEGLIPLYQSQIDRIQKDKEKEADFIKHGFNYHVLWESDIYKNLDEAMKEIKIQ